MNAEALPHLAPPDQGVMPETKNLPPKTAVSQVDGDRFEDNWEDVWRQNEEFLAFVAHEIRNPLVPLQNAVELLRLPTATGQQTRRAVDIVELQVCEMRQLLDDLLDATRIVRGKIELLRQPIHFAEAVGHAVEASRSMIENHGHQLTVALPAEPVRIMADTARLAQIVTGLLRHAAKSCSAAGVIKLSGTIEGDDVVLGIEDNGAGMPGQDLPRIFDLFHRCERSRGCHGSGAGLGLAVIRSLVEMHGGKVTVHSDGPGRSSGFRMHLPRMSESDTRACAASSEFTSAVLRLPPLRILLVADNAAFATEWCLLLRVAGHQALTVRTGDEILEAARTFRPHVVCLDVDNPKVDLSEVTQRLRADSSFKNAMVIAVSDSKRVDACREALSVGCASLLVKPVKIRDFLQVIVANASRFAERPGTINEP